MARSCNCSAQSETHTLDTLAGIKLEVTLQLLDGLMLNNATLDVHICHLQSLIAMTCPYSGLVKVVSFYHKQPAMQYMEYHWLALPAPECGHHSVKPLVFTNKHLAFNRKLRGQLGCNLV